MSYRRKRARIRRALRSMGNRHHARRVYRYHRSIGLYSRRRSRS